MGSQHAVGVNLRRSPRVPFSQRRLHLQGRTNTPNFAAQPPNARRSPTRIGAKYPFYTTPA
jgi:hypothetical protein